MCGVGQPTDKGKRMYRAYTTTCTTLLITFLTSGLLQIRVWGQKEDSLNNAHIQELEKRIKILEQTVKELQEHLKTKQSTRSQQPKKEPVQVLGTPEQTLSPEPPQNRAVRVSGYAFGDYYWMSENHNQNLEGRNGFWIRRAYLTFDKHLNDAIDMRLRFEMNSAGDFTTKKKLTPFIKDAWIRWKYSGNHRALVGIQPSPTKEVLEKFWGYRSLEKTLLDLQKWGNSRDFGVGFDGNIDSQNKLRYHFMLGNGSGDSSDINSGKKTLLSLAYYPSDNFILEFYSDYENLPDSSHRRTLQGFVGYQKDWGRLGVQYARQIRTGNSDLALDSISVFGVYNLSPRANLIGRYDRMFDPNPDGERISFIPFNPEASFNFFLAGLDFKVSEEFSFIPNVEVVRYDKMKSGPRPNSDLIPRLTFYYRF